MLRPYNPNLDVKPFEVLSCVDYGDIAIVPGFTERSLRRDRGGRRADRRGGRRPAPGRRRPRLHAAPPPRDAVARPGRGHRLRLAHRRLGLVLRREVQPRDVDAAGDRGGARRRRPLDRGRAARLALRRATTGRASGRSSGSSTSRPRTSSGSGPAAVAAAIRDRVGDRPAFISFDIDVVDPAYAPGTGTPEAGGPSARDMLAIVRGADRHRLRRVRRRRGHPGLRSGRPDGDAGREPRLRDAVARRARGGRMAPVTAMSRRLASPAAARLPLAGRVSARRPASRSTSTPRARSSSSTPRRPTGSTS